MHGQHYVQCVDKIHMTYVRNCHCMPVENCYSRLPLMGMCIYREIAIAIQKESGDSNGGNVWCVTMRITFNIPEFTRN